MDGPQLEDFGSTEALLKEIQERSDDIEKAVILPPGFVFTYLGQAKSLPLKQFGLVLHFANERKVIFGDDVAVVLNDGILNRMRIQIELAKNSV